MLGPTDPESTQVWRGQGLSEMNGHKLGEVILRQAQTPQPRAGTSLERLDD
jgi:hypothetical protein